MTRVKLLHNPKAGDEEHSCDDIIAQIEAGGFTCEYSSVKDRGWNKLSEDLDFLAIAGGDGTVKKVIAKLLQRRLIDKKFPIAVLPFGTANNLAKTLHADIPIEAAIESWRLLKTRFFDVGKIYGFGRNNFFIEAFGLGVFPSLIQSMHKVSKVAGDTPEQELKVALTELRQIIGAYNPSYCKIEIDGADFSGNYLMVEIMNTSSIGPNLLLAPDVLIDDGEFDIVLVSEENRTDLSDYISSKLEGREMKPALKIIKGHNITLEWEGTDAHVDDKAIRIKKPEKIRIEMQNSLLEFLI